MNITRYILTQGVKTENNIIVPIWDERIVFEKTEMYGNKITLKDDRYKEYSSLVDCIFDLKNKTLSIGIELNNYPTEKQLEFKIGEIILFEKSTRVLAEAIITDIVYEEYDLRIIKGKKMESYEIQKYKDIEIDLNCLYAIKTWKPFYILDNGKKIEWNHQLYHKNL